MIPVSLLFGAGFLAMFIWNVNHGQFDDVHTPAHRILDDEEGNKND
jgi:cbb3-type cytochrome oxidase maturation protein